MQITQITPESPQCYGVCCHLHGSCLRYQSVEGSSPDALRIDYCGMEYALYIPVLPDVQLLYLAAQAGQA